MGSFSCFEDIEAWQDARVLVGAIYRACQEGPLGRDFALKDQIIRSSISIMANIAEGFGRQRNTEFIHYLRIAAGSCAETQSHLYIALDNNLISKEEFTQMSSQTTIIGKKISALRRHLNQQIS